MPKKAKTTETPAAETSANHKKIDETLAQIAKEYGEGAIMRLGEMPIADVEAIPSGSLTLDLALGIGGIPRGRVLEIYGPESSGKTTLALHMIAEAQKEGLVAAFIDAEHALDPNYAKNIGVDIKELLLSQPDNGEQALEIVEALIQSGAVGLIVIDSVAALTPRKEIEGEMGDAFVGLQARLMSQALRKITALANKSRTTVLFINQLRMKIGVMFGNPETTPGGNALKFYSSVRMDIRRIEAIKKGEEHIGNRVRVKVVKNKMAPPFRQAEFDIIFNNGVDHAGEVLDLAVKYGLVGKAGAWFEYEGVKIAQGREGAKEWLTEHKPTMRELEKTILKKDKEQLT
jgi:recombination protein RecA